MFLNLVLIDCFQLILLSGKHLLHQKHLFFYLFELKIFLLQYFLLFFDDSILLLNLACKVSVVIIKHEFSITDKADTAALNSDRILRRSLRMVYSS
jgi:hypothetical protein